MKNTFTSRFNQLASLLKVDNKTRARALVNLSDFISTTDSEYYYRDAKHIYKTVYMFGAKTLVYNLETGRISTRNGWESLNKLKLTVIE